MVKTAAIAAPPRNHLLSTSLRPPLSSTPMKIATARKPTLCLFVRPSPRTSPTGQPPAAIAGTADPHGDERQRRPGEHVEGRRSGKVVDRQQGRHCRRTDRGEKLRPAGAAELAGDQAADHDRGEAGERRPEPQRRQRDSEQMYRDPRQQRDEHGLVDVAALQMTGGVEKVELVAMEAVEGRERHQHDEHEGAGDEDAAVE